MSEDLKTPNVNAPATGNVDSNAFVLPSSLPREKPVSDETTDFPDFQLPSAALPTAQDIQDRRVQKALPQARKIVATQPTFLSALGQTADFPILGPLGQRMAAAGMAGMGYGTGDDYSTRYANVLAQGEALTAAEREANPLTAQLGSGVYQALGAVGLPSLKAGQAMGALSENAIRSGAVPTTLQTLAKWAGYPVEGALWGAAMQGSEVTPNSTAVDVAKNMVSGAVPGALLSTAIPAAIKGVSAAGSGLARSFMWNPEAVVADAATRNSGAPGLTVAAYTAAKQNGEPVNVADIKGMKPILANAAGHVPEDQNLQELQRQLIERFQDRSAYVGQSIDNAFGRSLDAATIRAESQASARKINPVNYDAAFSQPTAQSIITPELLAQIQTKTGQQALNYALEESQKINSSKGMPGFSNPFIQDQNGIWNLPISNVAGGTNQQGGPSLEFWDYYKRGLDKIYTAQKALPGAGDMVGGSAYSTDEMRRNTLNILTSTVPEYADALSGAGRYFKADNAFDAGYNFGNLANISKSSNDPYLIGKQLIDYNKNFSDAEKETFSQGLGAFFKSNPSDAAKIFANADSVTLGRYKSVLGEERFNSIDSALAIHRLAAATPNVSPASSFLTDRAAPFTTGTGLLGTIGYGALNMLQGESPNFYAIGASALAYGGAKTVSSVQKSRAANILQMANSNDPDVLLALQDAAAKNPQITHMIKFLEEGLTRSAIAKATSPPSQQSPDDRAPRKTGGKVSDSAKHDRLLGRLMALTEKAKRTEEASTKPLLNAPDEAIVHALHVANAAI